jgi:diguanylate cyclase (GGDEF)-like protein
VFTPRTLSLRTSIALAFSGLLLVIQVVAFGSISAIIANNARRNVDEQLAVAQNVVEQIIRSRRERLGQAANVLAADFGFREAAATRDRATIVSALRNHGDRIGAEVLLLIGLEGQLIADTRAEPHALNAATYQALIGEAKRQGAATAIGMIDERIYELVAVPVRAPLTIAWVVMGFEIDERLTDSMRRIASLDVSFLARTPEGDWRVMASSLSPGMAQGLLPAIARDTASPKEATTITIDDHAFAYRRVRAAPHDDSILIVLQHSLDAAMAPFHRLQSMLALLTVAGVLISIFVSMLIARKVTRPVSKLIDFARRISSGEYPKPIHIQENNEIRELAHAFNHMRGALLDRETRITALAYQDVLTGLPNRARFNDRVQQAIAAACENDTTLAIMMMDLDRFKYVNDTLGHHIGDLLLVEVSRRLKAALRHEYDTVARLGGDEFAVLLPGGDVATAVAVAVRMTEALQRPITVEGQLVDVSTSIGIVTLPHDGTDMNTLMRRADVAMYASKRAGEDYARYDATHDKHTPERLTLMSELRHAVEHDELTLYYQPKLDLSTGVVKYVEALVRWEHQTRGFVSPDQFIPFAEQTGYIKSITRWVIDRAFAQCADWHARGIDLQVSVNVSARDLLGSDLPGLLARLLDRHRVDPAWIWIEITESAVMDDPLHAMNTLDRLHALGLRLSIDDFGTGYSSLAYLKRMPVDELKIDRSFVIGMAHDKDDETIVRSTIDLGHNMGLKVVAEGVESEAVLQQLKRLHCDLAQGYFMSRPLPPGKLEAWLHAWHGPHNAHDTRISA